jgi:hypothetical protein
VCMRASGFACLAGRGGRGGRGAAATSRPFPPVRWSTLLLHCLQLPFLMPGHLSPARVCRSGLLSGTLGSVELVETSAESEMAAMASAVGECLMASALPAIVAHKRHAAGVAAAEPAAGWATVLPAASMALGPGVQRGVRGDDGNVDGDWGAATATDEEFELPLATNRAPLVQAHKILSTPRSMTSRDSSHNRTGVLRAVVPCASPPGCTPHHPPINALPRQKPDSQVLPFVLPFAASRARGG